MNYEDSNTNKLCQLFDLAHVLDIENNWHVRIQQYCWKLTFLFTLQTECTVARHLARLDNINVSDIGLSQNFHPQAVNYDIFVHHRLLMGKHLSSLLCSCTALLPWLEARFTVIVSNYVIRALTACQRRPAAFVYRPREETPGSTCCIIPQHSACSQDGKRAGPSIPCFIAEFSDMS
jgi:hypothetical protein